MPDDPGNQRPGRDGDPPYRVYRAGRPARSERSEPPRRTERDAKRPYTTYRAAPRGLRERLRDPDDAGRAQGDAGLRELRAHRRSGSAEAEPARPGTGRARATPLPGWDDADPLSSLPGGDDADPLSPPPDEPEREHERRRRFGPRRPLTPWRIAKWVAIAVVAWLVLSLMLFLISAQVEQGSGLPRAARQALASGPNMLTGTDTILVLGLDQRPKGSKERGAFHSGIRSDSIMLWRIGGGTSRRLSIPRDTLASIPGYGTQKINAAYAYGGAALAIRTIEDFTGIRKINHLIVVNLANFPKFIDAIGGVDVHTGRICSNISGGVRNGGFSLYLKPGSHHLSGSQALTLARTRENACDTGSNDLTRDAYQQKILNAIKGKLTSPSIFFHLPWTAWRAPQAVRTDMGGPTMLSLFLASEIGGSAPTDVLHPAGAKTLSDGEDALVATPAQVHAAVHRLLTGRRTRGAR